MRVTIQRGIELNDIPSEIEEMISEINVDLEDVIKNLEACAGLCNTVTYLPTVVAILDNTRKKLADVDRAIGDSQAIADGLVGFLNGDNQPKEQPPEESPPASDPTDELRAMSEMLANMGEQLDATSQESDVQQG